MMQMVQKILCVVSLLAAVVASQPVASDTSAVEQDLFKQLASASNEARGRKIESDIWQYWFSLSPTADVRSLLERGRERRETYDLEGSEMYFDQVVEAAPDYFEGYNQRAFTRFLRENFEGSLSDLEKTLQLYPNHFGALSGLYHVLRVQSRHQAAFEALKKAVVIHPWILERSGLPKDQWPESFKAIHDPGQEI